MEWSWNGLPSLKGCNKPAQGNALGIVDGEKFQALKGRNRPQRAWLLRPFRAWDAFDARVPRALPWAGFFGPFRAEMQVLLRAATPSPARCRAPRHRRAILPLRSQLADVRHWR